MKKLNTKPEFKTEVKSMCNCIVEIDNPYLQAFADAGAYVMATRQDGFWIMTSIGQLWLKIQEDTMYLECIAVADDQRRQGNGSKLMGYVTQISDETQIPVKLQVSIVTRGNFMGMTHPVVALGETKKNKIPLQSLPKWYEKLGFTKSPSYSAKKKEMIYTPKKLS